MNWYNFIFSENKSDRLGRHLVFWLLWWIYFTISFFHYEQSGLQKIEFEPWDVPFFIKSLVLLSVHVAACYYFINISLPNYLLKGRYGALTIQVLILGLFILIVSFLIHKTLVPIINTTFNHRTIINQNIWWTSITSGLLSAPKVICAAAAIKLLKRWWLKQKEKERLEKERLVTELKLLKSQIHPEFLFSSLKNIGALVEKKYTDKASMLLLKLADILSYILYECDSMYVPLDKEINTIKGYLLLQKTSMGNKLEIDVAEKGNMNDQMIAPLLLLPFIESSFSYFDDKNLEKNWINLEFQNQDGEFTMKLIHGKTMDTEIASSSDETLCKTIRRLDYFYCDNYELKTTVEPEIMMTSLKIKLGNAVENEKSIYAEQLIYDAV